MDTWNRVVALSRRGASVHLVSWTDGTVERRHLEIMRGEVADVELHARDRAYIRALHPKLPTNVVSRKLSRAAYAAELDRVKRLRPDLVFLDSLVGAVLAISLADDLNAPLVYRSHNVEHQYIKDQAHAAAISIKKALLYSNVWRTKRIEREVRRLSSLIYEISAEDLETWGTDQNVSKAKVLNYLMHPDKTFNLKADVLKDIDTLYVGNLNTPNNVFGLAWFANVIAPLLEGERIVVAGSRPTPKIRSVLENAGIEVLADPEEVYHLYTRARVLINPVWHSSGVNIKMIELLATGKPVVSTSAGTRGLTKDVLRHARIADTPEAFAQAVLGALEEAPSNKQQEAVARDFGWMNVDAIIGDLEQLGGAR